MRYNRDGESFEVLIERGLPVPQWIKDEPDLLPGQEFYLKAFWELSTERQIGFSVGPIPASCIFDYGKRYGLDRLTLHLFTLIMRRLDRAYLDYVAEQQEKRKRVNARLSDKGSSRSVGGPGRIKKSKPSPR